MTDSCSHTLDYLRKLCASREYCSADILEKALKRLETREEAEKAVEQLKDEGFLSDLRYATAFCRDKSAISGWGPVKIRFALSGKGIPKALIDEAMSQIDMEKSGEKLEKVLLAKYKILKGDSQIRIKLLKFALSRGYEYDAVNNKVSEILYGKNENLYITDSEPDR